MNGCKPVFFIWLKKLSCECQLNFDDSAREVIGHDYGKKMCFRNKISFKVYFKEESCGSPTSLEEKCDVWGRNIHFLNHFVFPVELSSEAIDGRCFRQRVFSGFIGPRPLSRQWHCCGLGGSVLLGHSSYSENFTKYKKCTSKLQHFCLGSRPFVFFNHKIELFFNSV